MTDVLGRSKALALAAPMLAMSMLTVGCIAPYTSPVAPPPAAISNIQVTLDVDYDETQLGSKRGEATVTNILLLVALGDASAATAARNAGITTIRHADYKYFNVLGIYSTFTIVVYGD